MIILLLLSHPFFMINSQSIVSDFAWFPSIVRLNEWIFELLLENTIIEVFFILRREPWNFGDDAYPSLIISKIKHQQSSDYTQFWWLDRSASVVASAHRLMICKRSAVVLVISLSQCIRRFWQTFPSRDSIIFTKTFHLRQRWLVEFIDKDRLHWLLLVFKISDCNVKMGYLVTSIETLDVRLKPVLFMLHFQPITEMMFFRSFIRLSLTMSRSCLP